jgi:3-deoxy-D-arabino-heptulosonate 7-phosphate (DAHP) synthase
MFVLEDNNESADIRCRMHVLVSGDSLEQQATTRSYMYYGMSLVDVCSEFEVTSKVLHC